MTILPMGLCDRICVILWTNRTRCALNKEILDLLTDESVSRVYSGRASLRSLLRVFEKMSRPLKCHTNCFFGGEGHLLPRSHNPCLHMCVRGKNNKTEQGIVILKRTLLHFSTLLEKWFPSNITSKLIPILNSVCQTCLSLHHSLLMDCVSNQCFSYSFVLEFTEPKY